MNPVYLAIDVMGGDFGPSAVVTGVVEARQRSPRSFHAILCGDIGIIKAELRRNGISRIPADGSLKIEECRDTLAESDSPSLVWKQKSGASIIRCISLQKEGRAHASISAGNTGVFMAAAVFILGRERGVSRPALAALMPSMRQQPILLLDVGANLECRAEHLVSFARLGLDFMSRGFGMEMPTVALLNVGTEPTKGTRAIIEAGKILGRTCPQYHGFIEGSRVLAADADVVVCDGFAGNVLLKACGSFYALTRSVLGDVSKLPEAVRQGMAAFNTESYGVVPLLGVRGSIFKAHGNSSSDAIAAGIFRAVTVCREKIGSGVSLGPKRTKSQS